MRDADIRAALVTALRAEHADPVENRVWSEFSVSLGASRVDLCLVNGALTGWEIKSPRDNFARLGRQVEQYGRVLDFAHLVVASKDLQRARDSVPAWWGLVEARATDSEAVRLRTVRRPRRNRQVDPLCVAQLLWRDEALEELSARGISGRWSRATRWQLWDALVETVPVDELRRLVRSRLKARPIRAADLPYMPDGVM